MHTLRFLVVLFVFALVFFQHFTVNAQISAPHISNEILVNFTPDGESAISSYYKTENINNNQNYFQKIFSSIKSAIPFFYQGTQSARALEYAQLVESLGITNIDPDPSNIALADAPTIKLSSFTSPHEVSAYNYTVFTITFENGSVEDAIKVFADSTLVSFAQPNYLYEYYATPDDPLYNDKASSLTGTETAWDSTTGSKSVVVAVVDSGVDYNHEDLRGNMWDGLGTIENSNDLPANENESHGTGMAGAIGAVGNNNIGIAGVSWEVSIMSIGPRNQSNSLGAGVRRAADNGAHVINISIGSNAKEFCDPINGYTDRVLNDAISYATRDKNVLLIVASGNDSTNAQCDIPSNHPDVLAVTALGTSGSPENYSNYGPVSWKNTKILASPLGNPTTFPNNQYASASGTSLAAPYVSGAAALILSKKNISALELRAHLINTADDYSEADKTVSPNPNIPNDDGKVTYGKRLNIARAISTDYDNDLQITPTIIPTASASATPTPISSLPTATPTPSDNSDQYPSIPGKTLQVDWVYDDQARCWSAWADNSCTLIAHEGGADETQRDLDGDGSIDITCSQGDGSEQTTTVTNISDHSIDIICERYGCSECTSGNNSHAQCDGGIDSSAIKVRDVETITPGCVATCTINGAYGDCLDQKIPPTNQTPTPTPTGQIPPTSTPATDPSPTPSDTQQDISQVIQSAIGSITDQDVESMLRNLVDDDDTSEWDQEQTRYTGSDGYNKEFDYMRSLLESKGYTIETQETSCSTAFIQELRNLNVKNLIVKYDNPNTSDTYLVTAHLDSRMENIMDNTSAAPGADDNGTGSVAVVSIAQALSTIKEKLSTDIEFVLFSGEEQGLCGSTYYADTVSKENVKGVINLDMIGNLGTNGSACVNFGYKNYNGGNVLSDTIVEVNNTYSIGLTTSSHSTSIDASDHKPFWDRGIPAIFGTECNLNSRYHTDQDKVDFISYDQLAKTARAVSAAIIKLTYIQELTATPTPSLGNNTKENLPLMISYRNYQSTYNIENSQNYLYGWLTDASLNNNTSEESIRNSLNKQINDIKNISSDEIKMMMTSSYGTTETLLKNHSQEMKDAGITILGYNMELSVGTPQTEIDTMHISNDNNSVVKYVQLAKQYGFDVIWGPIRPNSYLAGKESQRAGAIKLMKDAGLIGVAFQEQKPIETETAENRRDVVIADVNAYKEVAGDDFKVFVQVMSSKCGSNPWDKCMQFLDYIAPNIAGIGIWASGGSDVSNIPLFISTIRSQQNVQNTPTPTVVPTVLPTQSDNNQLSQDEKETLNLINQERTSRGLKTLMLDNAYSNVARSRAGSLLESNSCEHGSIEEFRKILKQFGISGFIGKEIISCGGTTPSGSIQGWLSSNKGHREAMLSSSYSKAGVGTARQGNNVYRVVILSN